MRITSSTRSALPPTSGRQLGTVTERTAPSPVTPKPRRVRMAAISSGETVMPQRRSTSASGNSITLRGSGTLPASVTVLASPPQKSMTSWVAMSRPGRVRAGSMPRSKR